MSAETFSSSVNSDPRARNNERDVAAFNSDQAKYTDGGNRETPQKGRDPRKPARSLRVRRGRLASVRQDEETR